MAFQKAFCASCAYTHSLLYPFPNPFNPPINYVLMVLAPVCMYFFNIICLLFCLNFIHAYTMNDYILDVILSLAPHRSTSLFPTASQFCALFFLITHQVQFVLLIYSWAWAHPQFDLHITPLKKSDSPSLHSHH